MWKRDEAVKPVNGSPSAPMTPPQPAAAPAAAAARTSPQIVPVGKSVVIKGELSGSEDLTVEGAVDGTIDLKDNVLTIGVSATITAQVLAKAVVVLGNVRGNISASERVDIHDGASVDGDIVSPRLSIAEGAQFRGSVDMRATPPRQQSAPSVQNIPTRVPDAKAAAATTVAH